LADERDVVVEFVIAMVPDLMDRSRLEASAEARGVEVKMCRSPSDVLSAFGGASGSCAVVLDLGSPGALDVVASLKGTRTVGFASHVDKALITAARNAGCSQVLARSAFFSDPMGWALGLVKNHPAASGDAQG
jgi:hypothetical protein